MSTHVWFLSAALAVTALLDWWAVARGEQVVERIAKPTFMVLLGGLAWSLHGEGRVDGAPPLVPLLVALGLSLVGDVALLRSTEVRFVVGLAAFLLAHLAYGWTFLLAQRQGVFPWWLLAVVPLLVVAFARYGRLIVRSAGRDRVAVFVYQVVIFAMVLLAGWLGDPLVLLGAVVFVVSDTLLGHDRFVRERRWAPVQVMVTYHVAQLLIVVGLLR